MVQGYLTRRLWLLVCPVLAMAPLPIGADPLVAPGTTTADQLAAPALPSPDDDALALPQVLAIEPGPMTYYRDRDGDGYGDPKSGIQAPVSPEGYVERALDCDDDDPTLTPETLWFMDEDGDSYGDPAFTLIQCNQPAGYVRGAGDCDDTDPAYHPGASEEGLEAIDDYDCDGHVAGGSDDLQMLD